jgi:hypothetical protein
LRHLFATMARKEHGLEVTQVCAERNDALATKVAGLVG